jgi:hypothetical protein
MQEDKSYEEEQREGFSAGLWYLVLLLLLLIALAAAGIVGVWKLDLLP